MAWVRLEDTFPEHPKIDAVGGDAAWLHVCAIAYCNRNETDGFVAAERVARLSDRRSPLKLAARLEAARLWEPAPGGWVIHDYLDYQPSRSQRDEERAKARERMRNNRRSSPNVQANNRRSSPSPDPTRPEGITTTSNIQEVLSTAAGRILKHREQTGWGPPRNGAHSKALKELSQYAPTVQRWLAHGADPYHVEQALAHRICDGPAAKAPPGELWEIDQ